MNWFPQFVNLLSPYFVNPALVAGGAALVSSPIIIHFINRMRYRRVRFAAMEFLLASQKRNRRRLLIEQLLLLLLRILVVVALILLLGRLILDPSQLSIFEGAKAHHVVLLDDSGSMRDRWGETDAFEEAKEVVRKLVSEGAQRPQTQTFTLMLLSQPDEEFILQADVDEQLVRVLSERFENLKATHQELDLGKGLDAAGKFLAQDRAGIKHLHVISDFRKRDWDEQRAVTQAVKTLDDAGVTVNLIRAVPERHANLGITDLSGDLNVAAQGVPLWLSVTVKNFSDQVADKVRLTLLQDGKKLPLSVGFDEKIEPGESAQRNFSVTFETAGRHQIEVQLEPDALAADNRRFLAVDVPIAHPVLIVDGDPKAEDAQYIADSIGLAGLSGFDPAVRTPDVLRTEPLDRYQCIYLLNVPELPPDALGPLARFVRGGGGLIWYAGGKVQPTFYNENLSVESQRLFPVPLARTSRELEQEPTPVPDIQFRPHPIFRVYQSQDVPYADLVSIFQWFPVAETWTRDDNQRADGVRTIATLRNGEPLMFEHDLGEGRILTCLTTAGPAWNNWANGPGTTSFPVLQLEMVKHVARNDGRHDSRTVGEPMQFALDPSRYTEVVKILTPDAPGAPIELKASPQRDNVDAALRDANASRRSAAGLPSEAHRRDASATGESAPPLRLLATFDETDTPGIYVERLLNQEQVEEEVWRAYNVPPAEGDLELASTPQILKLLGNDVQAKVLEYGTYRDLFTGKDLGQEVRNGLLIALLVLLVAEQALAYRLSYHPKTAGAAA